VVCVKGSTCNEFKVDYYEKLKKVIRLQYHNEQNKVFLLKYYWYDTTNRGIRVDLYHGLVEINLKAKLYNVDDVFIFTKQCQQVYYTYTSSLRKDRSGVDWLSVVKTKPRGHVEVVQDGNDKLIMRNVIFELGELVDPYRVAPFNGLEENLNFGKTNNIFLLMLTLRSWMMFWAPADIYKSMKMIAMKSM